MTFTNLYYKKHLELLKSFETQKSFLAKLQSVYHIYSNLFENFNHIFFPENSKNQLDRSDELIAISLKKATDLLAKIDDMHTFFDLKKHSKLLCNETSLVLKQFIQRASNFKEREEKIIALQEHKKLCHHLSLAIVDYL